MPLEPEVTWSSAGPLAPWTIMPLSKSLSNSSQVLSSPHSAIMAVSRSAAVPDSRGSGMITWSAYFGSARSSQSEGMSETTSVLATRASAEPSRPWKVSSSAFQSALALSMFSGL